MRPQSPLFNFPWHSAPRRWGHGLHSLCSYMAMFPPALPHFFIRWLTLPGQVVYDPFSGRGTTLLESGLLGRRGMGSDANPLAWILSSAKAQPCSLDELQARIREIQRHRRKACTKSVPAHVRPLFSESVLSQLQSIKGQLNTRRKIDRFLLATLCGILHANAKADGTPRGLTVAMPNTFAMAPGYVARYIEEHNLKPPEVNVLDALNTRLVDLDLPGQGFSCGKVWMQDAAASGPWPAAMPHASLVFTSPPYLEVMKYGKLNWIRSWLIGEDPRVIDSRLFASASLPKYLDFTTRVLQRARAKVKSNGWVCMVIGDVRRDSGDINLAEEVIKHCVPETDLSVVAVVADNLPIEHKVSRIWGATRGRATKTDRIIIMGGPKTRDLPPIPSIDWGKTPALEAAK